MDFNDKGDCFLTCCVIPHLFHMVQGARYHRQGGVHFNQHTYADIPTIANHRHWVGNQWNDADRAKSDGNGGGHAHAGAMIYLGDTWPEKYRGQLFMNNIHGARLNVDRLTPRGSGYVGDGEPDFLKANDLWSQILYLRSGPDGNVYMIDWYDRNQCHHGNAALHDRSNGRIFKIDYAANRERKRPEVVDLTKKSDQELVELQLHKNDWYVRQARRLLMERAAVKKLDPKVRETLEKMAFEHEDASRRLRGLWALHVTGGLNAKQCEKGLLHEDEQVRRWTIQLGFEDGGKGMNINTLWHKMMLETSPVVRLASASALQRMNDADRWQVANALLKHAEDANDHNLPLLYWYGIEPLIEKDTKRALRLLAVCRLPQVQSYIIRRLGANGESAMIDLLIGELASAKETETQLLFLRGLQDVMVGRLQSAAPKGWASVHDTLKKHEKREVRRAALALAVSFNDAVSRAEQRAFVADMKQKLEERREGLSNLTAVRDQELLPLLQQLLKEDGLRGDALRGLALFDDPKTPELLLSHYPALSAAEKRDALSTLTSRVGYARTLLDAVGARKVASTDLTADLVRQMRSLMDEAINKQIEKVWGIVRESPEEKAKQIVYYKRLITSVSAKETDLPLGRAVFAKICAQCHTLFDDGGKVGPELTGSNRRDLDYVLSNVLDPSAVLAKEYIPSVVETKAGRFLVGLIREETKNAVTVVTAQEKVIVPRAEIESMTPGDKSMMPDDLLKALTEREVRALIAYLASPRQVSLPPKTEDGK